MSTFSKLTLLLAVLTMSSVAWAQQYTTEEWQLIHLINQTRARSGLQPLAPDPQVTAVARAHSHDMARHRFLAHVSPRTGDVNNRLRGASVSFRSASQNIAIARSVHDAHRVLMGDLTNRNNVLSRDFSHIGVGVAKVGRRLFVTENFLLAFNGFGSASRSRSTNVAAPRSPWARAAQPPLGAPFSLSRQVQPAPVQQPQVEAQEPSRERRFTSRRRARRQEGPQQCSVEGAWTGTVPDGMLRGRPLTLVFSQNGTARGTSGSITTNTRWSRQGDVVNINDINGYPSMAACPVSQTGSYRLAFSSDCQTVQVVSGNDGCRRRNLTLQGLQARRSQ